MNAAEMKRAAGRALELGLTAVLTVPVVLVILAAAAAVLLALTNWVKPTKNLHPIVFIAASAVVGVVFRFAGV